MGTLVFQSNPTHTLGVELELGLTDKVSGALSSSIQPLLDGLPDDVRQWCKPELMQCCVEVITDVCDSVDSVEIDLRKKLLAVQGVADEIGVGLWWGSTHPFSRWSDQQISPSDRYANLVNLLQEMARRLVTFGLHVHVGVDSGDKAVMICDRIMQHLPTLLALTASSPFWEDRNTGLQSQRAKVMEGLPTAGLPTLMRNWSEYVWLVNHMVDTGFINTIREIWWDVRPHHGFGTVEVRVCDMPGSLDDVLAVTALIQSLVAALSEQIDQGTYQHDCHPMMVRQNKWRAARFGTRAELVNSYTHEVQAVPATVERLIRRLEDTAQSLGCLPRLQSVYGVAERAGWSYQQTSIAKDEGVIEMVRTMSRNARLA
ncbi:MAG: YbdK family carboxylate-amine ligase [Pirellulaceae bacterium]